MKKFICVLCGVMIFMFGCGRPAKNSESDVKQARSQISIKGSDTMVLLVSAWAEAFMKSNPGSEISVTGGGTGTGIAALINKTTDICAASRDMSKDEKAQAAQKGVNPKEVTAARDGVAVIVNPANPINELTLEHLKKIFTGAWTDWAQTGAGSGEFIVLSRESSSGTYIFFQEHVLKKEDYTPKARLMPATSSIIQSVGEDKYAIGYVGLGYALQAAGKVKILKIKTDDAAKAVDPSESTVRDGSYSISRPLFLYASENTNEQIKRFIDFCLSEEGQKIARETGYVSVN